MTPPAKRGRGRPALGGEARTITFAIKLSAVEVALVERAAVLEEIPPREYARDAVLEKMAKTLRAHKKDR